MSASTRVTRHALRFTIPPRAQHHPQASRSHMTRLNIRSYSNASPSTSFTYRVAAASAAKSAPPRKPKIGQDFWNYASTDSKANPPYLRSTKEASGEDAFFATTVGGSKHHIALGVADGVGGWQEQGIDPSDFSQGLCGLIAGTAYFHEGLKKGENVRPVSLLQTAHDAVIANPRIIGGSSTASLAVLDEEGGVEAANLGDSAFLILSPGKVTHRAPPQTHAFNTPYQISKIPAWLQTQHAIFGGSQHFNESPAQADVTRHTLKHGDIMLFATDGVWDNLSAQDALGIVTRVMRDKGFWYKDGGETCLDERLVKALPKRVGEMDPENYLPGLLATAVMREAKVAGLDRRRDGPFAKEANARFPGEGWRGGKPDDIAVVALVAVEDVETGDEETGQKPIKAKL